MLARQPVGPAAFAGIEEAKYLDEWTNDVLIKHRIKETTFMGEAIQGPPPARFCNFGSRNREASPNGVFQHLSIFQD